MCTGIFGKGRRLYKRNPIPIDILINKGLRTYIIVSKFCFPYRDKTICHRYSYFRNQGSSFDGVVLFLFCNGTRNMYPMAWRRIFLLKISDMPVGDGRIWVVVPIPGGGGVTRLWIFSRLVNLVGLF